MESVRDGFRQKREDMAFLVRRAAMFESAYKNFVRTVEARQHGCGTGRI